MAAFTHKFTIPESDVDGNGHVNNVAYVQWMQDVGILHAVASGCTAIVENTKGTWVARSHNITYHYPCYAGEEVTALTWIHDFRSVRSRRRYKFLRESDNTILATGETDWVFVDEASGKPMLIPEEVAQCFSIVAEDNEP